MRAVRIGIGQRERGVRGQLALERCGGLQNVERACRRADLLNRLRRQGAREGRNRRNIREKHWIRHHIRLLHDSVVAIRRKNIRKRESIVERSKS